MSEELAQSGSDVSTEVSSTSTEAASSEPASNDNQKLSLGAENKPEQEKYVPYDRFKELVEQKNQFAKQYEDQAKALKDLQSKYESFSKPKPELTSTQKMINSLKERGVEPEYIAWMEQQEAHKSELQQLKEWREQSEKQNYNTAANAAVDRLKSELKVDKVLHEAYLARIQYGTPVAEIANRYKALHDEMSKFLDGHKRAALSEYTTAKKADAKVATPSRGQPGKPATPSKPVAAKDAESARAEFKKAMMEDLRAARNT